MRIISGGIFGDGIELTAPPPAPEPRVLWTDQGLVFEERYAANVIIPERSTLH